MFQNSILSISIMSQEIIAVKIVQISLILNEKAPHECNSLENEHENALFEKYWVVIQNCFRLLFSDNNPLCFKILKQI